MSLPEWSTEPWFIGGGVVLMALFAIVRRRVGDGPLAIAVGMVAAAAIWTGVSWTFAIGDEAVAAAFVTAIGIGEFGKRLSVSRGQR